MLYCSLSEMPMADIHKAFSKHSKNPRDPWNRSALPIWQIFEDFQLFLSVTESGGHHRMLLSNFTSTAMKTTCLFFLIGALRTFKQGIIPLFNIQRHGWWIQWTENIRTETTYAGRWHVCVCLYVCIIIWEIPKLEGNKILCTCICRTCMV